MTGMWWFGRLARGLAAIALYWAVALAALIAYLPGAFDDRGVALAPLSFLLVGVRGLPGAVGPGSPDQPWLIVPFVAGLALLAWSVLGSSRRAWLLAVPGLLGIGFCGAVLILTGYS